MSIDHFRRRDQTICFRVSKEEKRDIEARIAVSGMPKGEYFIRSLLHQQINIYAGKYQSDRLSTEIRFLSAALAKASLLDGTPEEFDVLVKCKALLSQIVEFMEATKSETEPALLQR